MEAIQKILDDKEFFIGDDVQRRYEMLRAWRMNDITQHQAADLFNESLPNFKRIWKRYQEEGISGLVDRKPGPKSRSETTEEIRPRIIELREGDMSIYEIADNITKEGTTTSYGTVNRVLKEEGYIKKTREKKQT